MATKHKSSSAKVIRQYTKDLIVLDEDGITVLARLPDKYYLGSLGRQYLPDIEKGKVARILRGASLVAEGKGIVRRCSVFGCTNMNVERKYAQHLPHFKKELFNSNCKLGNLVAMRIAIMRHPICLCIEHWSELHKGRVRLEHLDYFMIMGRKHDPYKKDNMKDQRQYNWLHIRGSPQTQTISH